MAEDRLPGPGAAQPAAVGPGLDSCIHPWRHNSTTVRSLLTLYDRSCYFLSVIALTHGQVGTFQLASLEPGDGQALRRFFFRLSPETLYRRFLSPIARPEQARPERLLDVDHVDREALVALVDGEIVGI